MRATVAAVTTTTIFFNHEGELTTAPERDSWKT
jgi:hypothetical protein